MRVVILVAVFALIGLILELATRYWVFQTHHDIPWSATDMLLLQIAIWPQILATRLGYSSLSSVMLLLLNSFGWALIGLVVGGIIRKRAPRS